jgi:DNA-binding transcriptional MerR regulator
MKTLPNVAIKLPPRSDPDESTYDLELVAELTGIHPQAILDYQEQGLIQTIEPDGNYNDESVYTLRLIEQLRSTCVATPSGIKLILELIEEVDRLRSALRNQR